MMTSLLFAIVAAALWGATDVLAGASSRRSNGLVAAVWLHAASLAVLIPVFAFGPHGPVEWGDLTYGALAGIAAAIGDVLFGNALAKSSMTVGIPIANVVAAALPAALGLAQGVPLSAISLLGIAGALLATGLATLPSNATLERLGALTATSAGVLFGLMYALLTQVHQVDVVAVIFIMRVAGLASLLPAFSRLLVHAEKRRSIMEGLPAGASSGITSVAANILFVFAASSGSRVVAPVLAIALSAPIAICITFLIARERTTWLQSASAFLGVAAIVLLAVSRR